MGGVTACGILDEEPSEDRRNHRNRAESRNLKIAKLTSFVIDSLEKTMVRWGDFLSRREVLGFWWLVFGRLEPSRSGHVGIGSGHLGISRWDEAGISGDDVGTARDGRQK